MIDQFLHRTSSSSQVPREIIHKYIIIITAAAKKNESISFFFLRFFIIVVLLFSSSFLPSSSSFFSFFFSSSILFIRTYDWNDIYIKRNIVPAANFLWKCVLSSSLFIITTRIIMNHFVLLGRIQYCSRTASKWKRANKNRMYLFRFVLGIQGRHY